MSSPDRVRRVWVSYPIPISKTPFVRSSLAHHEYRAIVPALQGAAELALYSTTPRVPIGRDDAPITASVTYTTASYFSVAGARFSSGRPFTDAESNVRDAARVAVVSDAFRRRYFGGAPDVIGQAIRVGGAEYTVIGVTATGFTGVDLQANEIWLPLGVFPTRDVPRVSFWDSSVILFSAIARLSSDAADRAVEERASTAYRHAPVTDFPVSDSARVAFRSIIAARGLGDTAREVSIALRLAVSGLFVLLLAAANVVNLLLACAVARRREVAVRMALGVSRARLARLFMSEALLLSFAAGLAALVAAHFAGAFLRSLLMPEVTFGSGPIGPLVVTVTFGLSLATGVGAGFFTAVYMGRRDVTHSLKSGTHGNDHGNSTASKVLVGTQAAFSAMALVGALLVVRSLVNVQHERIGFDVGRLAFASITLPYGERPDSSEFAAKMRGVGEEVRRMPGVEAVAFTRDEPMTGFSRIRFYTATDSSEGPDRKLPTASYVSADYFRAVGLGFTRGASFSDESESAATAVVVNAALANTFWPSRDPIGQCIYVQSRSTPCLTIVGVVENAIRDGVLEERAPQVYLPIFKSIRGRRPPTIMVLRADPSRLGPAMTRASASLRSSFARGVPAVTRMSDRVAPQYRAWRLSAALFSAFGALALAIAALGIYSSVSYAVSQRTRELGIRLALGATASRVANEVVARGTGPVLAGGLLGVILAIPGARLVSALLYNTVPYDPVMLASVLTLLMLVGVTAAAIPALRAARIDPVRSLSTE